MGSARVEFIYTRAVASTENEQDVLCLSIKSNDAFRFKTEINFQRQQQHLVDNTITILNIHLSERVIIMWLINQQTICFIAQPCRTLSSWESPAQLRSSTGSMGEGSRPGQTFGLWRAL